MAEVPDEQPLAGGGSTAVHRRGDVVLRQARPWSRTVLALLRHLELEGFAGAPRVVGNGFDDDGRETLTYVHGESPAPYAWSDDAAAQIGTMLRDLHGATAAFTPPHDAVWMPWFGRELEGGPRLIGHCDTGPWNVLARDGRPVALVDWDTAGPVGVRSELAQAVWLNAQLHDDDVAERLGLPDLAARAGQARLILDGYGLAANDRAGFVDDMIAFAVASAAQEAIDAGVTRDSTHAAPSAGSAAGRRSSSTSCSGRSRGEPAEPRGWCGTGRRCNARWPSSVRRAVRTPARTPRSAGRRARAGDGRGRRPARR